ncbi:MAG: NAD(+) synthase [Bacillota bacterium]|nr:MAG: NAD(+) synthase [Bacillota bacterium]
MNFGYVRATAASPKIRVADVDFNKLSVLRAISAAKESGAALLVLPELCLTGYTCGDLFFSDVLLNAAKRALKEIAESTAESAMLVFVGVPLRKDGLVYNCAAAINRGRVLAFVPKTYLPNYNEFYEKRNFAPCPKENGTAEFFGECVPFGKKLIFRAAGWENFAVAAEICEDLWALKPPSADHAAAGANIVVNLSCSNETVGKAQFRRKLVSSHSARLAAGYVYADGGEGESTGDLVFSGNDYVAENGKILAETAPFANRPATAEIDVDFLAFERSKRFNYGFEESGYENIPFTADDSVLLLTREYSKTPFVPKTQSELDARAELILKMQAAGLKKRVEHTGAKSVVIGLSGGLDSTLALLVAARAIKDAGRSSADILGVTMPCFGTTDRTLTNTVRLARALKITLKKINIAKSVERHLKDIGHPLDLYDAAYENAQARERTQVLMDIANSTGGLVVGTGDLSELALGWATYNGDHMSMYGVNASVPKTLVRYLVEFTAQQSGGKLKSVLQAILDTPVSPELLPAENGEISQKTEEIVGPYILHDFFLYHFIRSGFSPRKIFAVAVKTFNGDFTPKTIYKWLTVFVKRFFSQQFKRSCVPDGVKVGSVALSPRGDWRMPSDAQAALWLKELEEIQL